MNVNDIFKLIDAGFTKADIMALATGKQAEEPQSDNVADKPDDVQKLQDDLQEIKGTLQNIQKGNIQTSEQTGAKEETVEDVWKNFFEIK